ncbi:MAG: thermonuclease family protein [bacterium]|nr:thermonuclease family protein [bacterium]
MATPAAAENIAGRVIAVLSGDTFQILEGHPIRTVRLADIDCPDRGQDYGMRARDFTTERIGNRTVAVEPRERAPGGELIGEVNLADGERLSRALVGEGLAWSRGQYARDAALDRLQETASRERRGLWQEAHPTPPWIYRQRAAAGDPNARIDPLDLIIARRAADQSRAEARPVEIPTTVPADAVTKPKPVVTPATTTYKSLGGEIPAFYYEGTGEATEPGAYGVTYGLVLSPNRYRMFAMPAYTDSKRLYRNGAFGTLTGQSIERTRGKVLRGSRGRYRR